MATTTATVSISSADLMPGSPLNISASSTLMKTGITTGMELMEMGNAEVAQDYEAQLFSDAPATDNGAYFIYVSNNTTEDTTYYIEYKVHETVIGRLYAGDWMFVPYNASDGDAEIEVKALNGINKIEYAMFKTAWTLPAAES
tara:strand:- start:905 stop:1333 length:429 start_codon:yes stop_codon:yes gene_type:complete